MKAELLINVKVYRKQFEIQNFISENDFLILVESGSFSFESSHRSYTVKASECAHFKRNTLYRRKVLEPVELHLFRYSSAAPLFENEHLVFSDKTRISSTIHLLNRIHRNPHCETDHASQLFFDIVNQYKIEKLPFSSEEKKEAKIEAAITHMKNNLSESVPIDELAHTTNLSYVQFLRRFKAYTGTTPSEYLMSLRLQEAKNLLLDSDMQIKQIAKSCGFENEYYFSNFFKKHVRMAPSVFRKTMLQ